KVKLGGGGGGCNLSATIRTLTLWTTRHRSGRTLVRACDFITDMGHSPVTGRRRPGIGAGGARTTATGTGPEWMVTELGLFDFDDRGHLRLRATFPDVSVDDVVRATAFELPVADDVRELAPPSAAEIALVRRIDPLGVRRTEFGPD